IIELDQVADAILRRPGADRSATCNEQQQCEPGEAVQPVHPGLLRNMRGRGEPTPAWAAAAARAAGRSGLGFQAPTHYYPVTPRGSPLRRPYPSESDTVRLAGRTAGARIRRTVFGRSAAAPALPSGVDLSPVTENGGRPG